MKNNGRHNNNTNDNTTNPLCLLAANLLGHSLALLIFFIVFRLLLNNLLNNLAILCLHYSTLRYTTLQVFLSIVCMGVIYLSRGFQPCRTLRCCVQTWYVGSVLRGISPLGISRKRFTRCSCTPQARYIATHEGAFPLIGCTDVVLIHYNLINHINKINQVKLAHHWTDFGLVLGVLNVL